MAAEKLANIERRIACADNELALIWPSGIVIASGKSEDIAGIRRANLLIRSSKFEADYVRVYLPILKRTIKGEDVWLKKTWQDLCYKWKINGYWPGSLKQLHLFANSGAEIIIRDQSGEVASVPFEGCRLRGLEHLVQYRAKRWTESVRREPHFIYLKLSPQTGLKDVRRIWHFVEYFKSKIWEVSERKKRTFCRDLMIFDLHHQPLFGPLTLGHIARDLKISKAKVQQAYDRILFYIDRINRLSN